MKNNYDLVIVGGGPAGCAAAVYAGRKLIDTLLITPEFGGQSIVSEDIQNWIGDKHLPGMELAKKLEEHVKEYKGDKLAILKTASVTKIAKQLENSIEKKDESNFILTLSNGQNINAKSILIATGSKRRKLEAINADKFEHRGVTYCASCDGLFFAGKDVIVVGSGNAAFESATQLLAYCPSVTMLVRGDTLRADEITINAVMKNPNFKIIKNAKVIEVLGETKVIGAKIEVNDTMQEIGCSGIFVEIGQIANTEFARQILDTDTLGKIKIDPWTQATSQIGIWAAGDCTNIKYHQNNIAAGDGVKALEDIYQYLQKI